MVSLKLLCRPSLGWGRSAGDRRGLHQPSLAIPGTWGASPVQACGHHDITHYRDHLAATRCVQSSLDEANRRQRQGGHDLNTRNAVLAIPTIYQGNVSPNLVRVGELLYEAVRRQASSILLVHKHPSGDPTGWVECGAETRCTQCKCGSGGRSRAGGLWRVAVSAQPYDGERPEPDGTILRREGIWPGREALGILTSDLRAPTT
jgi:hypothetical protein